VWGVGAVTAAAVMVVGLIGGEGEALLASGRSLCDPSRREFSFALLSTTMSLPPPPPSPAVFLPQANAPVAEI
jgi:hypothetical protein